MKLMLPVCSVCVCCLTLSGCASLSALQSELKSAELNLDSSTYVVGHGESFETIAFRYKMTTQELRALNPSANMSAALTPGTYIRLRPTKNAPIAQAANQQVQGIAASTFGASVDDADNGVAEAVIIPQAVAVAPNPNSDEALLGRASLESTSAEQNASNNNFQAAFLNEEIIEEETFGLANGVDAASADRFSTTSDAAAVISVAHQDRFNGEWKWPTNGPVAREYDARKPNGRGIDIAGAPGQDVFAAKDGVVTFSGRDPSGIGKLVIVRHDDDYLSIYSHTRDLFVSENDTVNAGDPIASLGANANDEAMLRFELRKDGKLLNPIKYLPPL